MRTDSEQTGTCPVVVSGPGFGNYQPCGRTFKTDEQREAGLCGIHLRAKQSPGSMDTLLMSRGIHLRAKQKREEKDAREERRRSASDAARERAQAACDALDSLGVPAHPHYRVGRKGSMGKYTGKVVVDGEALLRMLEPKS